MLQILMSLKQCLSLRTSVTQKAIVVIDWWKMKTSPNNIPCTVLPEYSQHSRYHMGNSIQVLNRTLPRANIRTNTKYLAEGVGFALDKKNTQDNFRGPIMPSRNNVGLVLLVICRAAKINHLYLTGLGHTFVIGSLLRGTG
jgi:hypothetical protein